MVGPPFFFGASRAQPCVVFKNVVCAVPYFGDEDTTGLDVSFYDAVPGESLTENDDGERGRGGAPKCEGQS